MRDGKDFIKNLGHSTFIVKVSGTLIISDPFLSKSAFGIRRAVPPAMLPEEIEPDIVLISHAHYDHLDVKTIKRLKGTPVFIVPEGCREVIPEGKGEVVELFDFESTGVGNVRILKVPALHNRGRNLKFPNTGVGGYIFEVGERVFYFAGDTAFSEELYLKVKESVKRIDFAMLPIGGFMPKPFHRFHQTPEEALRGFKIIGASHFIPIHWGTWHAFPGYVRKEKPLSRLKHSAYVSGLLDKIRILKPGEGLTLT